MTRRFAGVLATAILVLVATASAAAKSKPITGKLSKGGYTLIALAESGRAQTVVVKRGKFKLRPPTKTVTLHLRAPNGTYAGPIVAGKVPGKGGKARSSAKKKRGKKQGTKQVVVGVKAGANLGKIKVNPGKGFAVVKRIAVGSLASEFKATATKKGVPIGAGVFGRVSVKKLTGRSTDRDRDGIPNPLDVDDDGDLILDNFDATRSKSASSAAASNPETVAVGRSFLSLSLEDTVNANAGSTTGEINDALSSKGKILLAYTGAAPPAFDGPRPDPGTLPEVDCAGDPTAVPPRPGLSYCSQGGTGRLDPNPFGAGILPPGDPFPACCDPDRDGFGSLVEIPQPPGVVYGHWLRHGATNDQIHTGDLFIMRVRFGGVETALPGVVVYVFATAPALKSYSDEAGNSAAVNYPVDLGDPGTPFNGFPVADGDDADSDVEVTLNFWRPQRPAAAGETGEWTDIGKLNYTAAAGGGCPPDAFTELSRGLTPLGGTPGRIGDSAPDRAPDPRNTFSFKLNLTKCAAGGFDNPGDETHMTLAGYPANSPGGGRPDADQASINFIRK